MSDTPTSPETDGTPADDVAASHPRWGLVAGIAAVGLVTVGIVAAAVSANNPASPSLGSPNPNATSVLDAYPDNTLAPEPPPAPGTVQPITVDLSESCTEAIQPLRAIQESTPSGASLSKSELTVLNDSLASARDLNVCSYQEYVDYTTKELLPWRRMPAEAPAEKTN